MVFDQSRRRVRIEMFDQRVVGNIDLLALDEGRYRNHHGEVFDGTLEVIRHRDNGTIAVAHKHDL